MGDKTDLERIGLFKEMSYITVDAPYAPPLASSISQNIKGRQILSEATKEKSSLDDGYFLKPFVRTFEGEGSVSYPQMLRKWRNDSKNKSISDKPFIPASGQKKQSGTGSGLGCLTEIIPYFSSVERSRKIKDPEKPNFYTNPGKKGTGYGYLDITISPYPTTFADDSLNRISKMYSQERDQHKEKCLNRNEFIPSNGYGGYFDPNPYQETYLAKSRSKPPPNRFILQKRPFIPSSYPKKSGNMKAGTLNPYPEHVAGDYKNQEMPFIRHDVRNNTGKLYNALPGSKSCIYKSIMIKNIEFKVNNLNSHKIKSVMNY